MSSACASSRAQCVHPAVHTQRHSACTLPCAHSDTHFMCPHTAVWRVLSTGAELGVAHTTPLSPPISCTPLPALICLPAPGTHLQGSHWRGQATSQGHHRARAAHRAGASLPAPAQGHRWLVTAAMQRGAQAADPLPAPGPAWTWAKDEPPCHCAMCPRAI